MGLILIGLGLDLKSISLEAMENLKRCEEVYLESYTVDFPYDIQELEKVLSKKIISISRQEVESESFLKNAGTKNLALLVYGDPFSATTHHQIILFCKKNKIPFEIFHNASILNSIAECGLSSYKFGKTCSLAAWTEEYRPSSFIRYVKENQSIQAHTLLLVDIGLEFKKALEQLSLSFNKEKLKLNEILVCSRLGTANKKFYFGSIDSLKKLKKLDPPFCFVIPAKMHFIEEDMLK